MLNLLFSLSGASTGGKWALSGTSLSPNNATTSETSPTNATSSWIFNLDGTVDRKQTAGTTQFETGVSWDTDQPSPATDMWIRADHDANENPDAGDALGVWHVLSGSGEANRTFTWTEPTDGGFFATTGTIKVMLATDSLGANVVATGYYKGLSTVEV